MAHSVSIGSNQGLCEKIDMKRLFVIFQFLRVKLQKLPTPYLFSYYLTIISPFISVLKKGTKAFLFQMG